MLGKGVSREHFQPRTCSGKNSSKTGQAKRDLENIVYIDLDSDQFDDVVILEGPEVVSKKLNGSSGPSRNRTLTPQSVISIDDDDDDGSDDVDNPRVNAEGVGELDSDASSSKRFTSASSSARNSVRIDVDDCDVYEKDSASKRQKSKGVFSSKASERNCYGLYGSENESSDSDCSDCELMEDREQWEKVSAMKKSRVFNDQSRHDEHASSSGLHSNDYINIEVKNRSEKLGKSPAYGPSSSKYVKENQSSFTVKDDIGHGERTTREKAPACPKSKNCDFGNGITGSSRFTKELGDEESKFMSSSQDEHDRKVDNYKTPLRSKESKFMSSSQDEHTGKVDNDKTPLRSKESKFMSSDQDEHDRKVDNDETPLRSKCDNITPLRSKCDNISEGNSNSASFDERNFNGHEFELHTQDGGSTASEERNIINEREKLKETDEYKQAMEEEWASRQKQLQIQDEEIMNMKEKLRAEIQKELNQLKNQCTDMTSLLRSLGINVGESRTAVPHEVHAAYKRAMFKFHPDRASKTDIRAQVEAEEKCKFITAMKEKFLSFSYR
ncbi:uncharacterized protein [Cicer arietinum]|uniref:Uncharacterized protein LOC101508180 isoform X2 n=1 Tax=Cicer arietinum TaxID=3827 RepID=A0A1S3DXX5_CICAR|nr:uncharacterized protein LOC101508180 isoform X2 [Cicer arietinum]